MLKPGPFKDETDLANLKVDLDFAGEKVSGASRRVEVAEDKLAVKEYLLASSDAKPRLQKVYHDLLKFVEGRATRAVSSFRKSADFQVEVAEGCSNAHSQGWEDCSYAIKELHGIVMVDPENYH